jgi:hypothetical protein
MNLGLAKTRINEAFHKIQLENAWSFQMKTGGFLTPGLLGGSYSGRGRDHDRGREWDHRPDDGHDHEHDYERNHRYNPGSTFLSPGTITVEPFTNLITGDAVATKAWNSITHRPLLTEQQIRVPYYALYDIIAQGNNGTVAYATVVTPGSGQTPGTYVLPVLDATTGIGATVSVTVEPDGTVACEPRVLTPGSGYTQPYFFFSEGGTPATFNVSLIAVLTIDRDWMEPNQYRSGYCIYQAYFVMPKGFRRHWLFRDTTNNNALDFSTYTQVDLAVIDAERTVFDEPLYVVPLGPDTRFGSSTSGQQRVELWPGPLSRLPYTFMCQADWPALKNPNDMLPPPLTEELVKERANEMIALWKEGNKGDEMERGSGANWMFLVKAHNEEYKDLLRQARIMDKHFMDLYFTKAQITPPSGFQDGFATMTGQINIGTF